VPADLTQLLKIAHRHKLLLIEDACEAIGAEYQGKKVGTFGDAGVFAFYPNKQITTAEGGVVVTNDPHLASKIKALRNHGRAADAEWLQHSEVGYNYRLSELHSALGVEQMKRIHSILRRREEIARAYKKRLADQTLLELPPHELADRKVSWFVYVVRIKEGLGNTKRDVLASQLAERGIETARYFVPLHLQPAYRGVFAPRRPLNVTESAGTRTLALPFFNRITDDQLTDVCSALDELLPSGG
jgi:perosamine synthetase